MFIYVALTRYRYIAVNASSTAAVLVGLPRLVDPCPRKLNCSTEEVSLSKDCWSACQAKETFRPEPVRTITESVQRQTHVVTIMLYTLCYNNYSN